MSAATFAASLRRAGRPMELRRRIGTSTTNFHTCTVSGKPRGYRPTELVGGVVQGDRRIKIALADIEAETVAGRWPGGPPKAGNTDKLDGSTVKGVEPLEDHGEVVGYVCWVTG